MHFSNYIILAAALTASACSQKESEHSDKSPDGSCLKWQSQESVTFDIPEKEFAEYLNSIYFHHKTPPDSQFGPRWLVDRIDGYKIARSKVFKGRLFQNNDVICQINDFNLVTTCAKENHELDQKCWEQQTTVLFEKLAGMAQNPKKLVGARTELRIYRNNIPIMLIIRIVP